MNIICITATIIALIIAITIIICVYLKHNYNPALYANNTDIIASVRAIARTILDRYNDYHEAEEKDKYAFSVSEKEIIDAFEEIKEITEL